MNSAFKKGKFSKWYGSRFYKSCITPKTSYTKWLSMQPAVFQDLMLGRSKGAIFRGDSATPSFKCTPFPLPPPFHNKC